MKTTAYVLGKAIAVFFGEAAAVSRIESEATVSSVAALLMSLAYYRWGGWRKSQMLAHQPHSVVVPAEVPAQPPSPVADVSPSTANDEAR